MATKIGSNCFIAGPSVIGPGVTIGDGVIVGPLTFVDRDVSSGDVRSTPRELKKLVQKVERLEELLHALAARLPDGRTA
jgi:UDP-3-O-[3-hydroxymyristoyl] glucosamine N-acyltransferase